LNNLHIKISAWLASSKHTVQAHRYTTLWLFKVGCHSQ